MTVPTPPPCYRMRKKTHPLKQFLHEEYIVARKGTAKEVLIVLSRQGSTILVGIEVALQGEFIKASLSQSLQDS